MMQKPTPEPDADQDLRVLAAERVLAEVQKAQHAAEISADADEVADELEDIEHEIQNT